MASKKSTETASQVAAEEITDTGKEALAVALEKTSAPANSFAQGRHSRKLIAPVTMETGEDKPGKSNRSGVADEEAVREMTGDLRMTQRSPGKMAMTARISYHTNNAINLFRGRQGNREKGQRPIIGLARFARQVSAVWNASIEDDPFADLCLIEIEAAHEIARNLVNDRVKQFESLLAGLEDVEINIKTSMKPVEMVLDFYCPWGYSGAFLLRQYDKLIRLGLTAKHVALISYQEWDVMVNETGTALRHMYAVVDRWVNTGVTRGDIQRGNRVAKRAATIYASHHRAYTQLPDDIVAGTLRAKLSPEIRKLGDLHSGTDKSDTQTL